VTRLARATCTVLLAGGAVLAPSATPVVAAATSCTDRTSTVLLPDLAYPLALYSARAALWSAGHDGAGVTVAVVDSGVEVANPHFATAPGAAPAVLPGRSFVPAGPVTAELINPLGQGDPAGHGTPVAGLVAAREVAGSGVVGLAPKASILPVQVYLAAPSQDARLAPAFPNAAQLAAGIRYAAESGARIIVVALSQDAPDPALADAVRAAHDAGALVVASAGDRLVATDKSDGPRYPAAYPGVLSVTAVTAGGQASDASIHGAHVGVAAPGERIPAAYGRWGDCVLGDAPATSYATPLVAAAAALLAQAYPQEGPDLWRYRIEASALRARSDRRDDVLGWGLLSPYDALTLTLDPSRPGPPMPGHAAVVSAVEPVVGARIDERDDPLATPRALGMAFLLAALGGGLALRLVRLLRREHE
jgi:membrane-anchored mycosin MYCP